MATVVTLRELPATKDGRHSAVVGFRYWWQGTIRVFYFRNGKYGNAPPDNRRINRRWWLKVGKANRCPNGLMFTGYRTNANGMRCIAVELVSGNDFEATTGGMFQYEYLHAIVAE